MFIFHENIFLFYNLTISDQQAGDSFPGFILTKSFAYDKAQRSETQFHCHTDQHLQTPIINNQASHMPCSLESPCTPQDIVNFAKRSDTDRKVVEKYPNVKVKILMVALTKLHFHAVKMLLR